MEMEEEPLFKEKKIPQQIVSVVPTLTTKALEGNEDKDDSIISKGKASFDSKISKNKGKENFQHSKTCSLCRTHIMSPSYYEVDGKNLHEYCYQAIIGPFCHCCSQPLAGKESIQALGKIYHSECLRCSICQENIGRNQKIESYKGIPICHSCYSKRCKACPNCNLPVLRGGIRFLFEGQMIHVHKDCAICKECGKNLTQKDFAFEQGEILCRSCWISLADFVCSECGEVILPSERVSYNGYRHTKCFKCHNCGVNLIKSDPEIVGDLLLCKRCFSGINTHCGICFEEVKDDQKIKRFGRVFHPKCFKCCKCSKPLYNSDSEFKKGSITCIQCLSLYN